MRPLPERADEPLRRDPRHAGARLPAGRHDPALPRRRADAPLHGHVHLRRVHRDAGDRAREGLPGGLARGLRAVRVWACNRHRGGAVHGRRPAGIDVRRLRLRPRGPRRGDRVPPGRGRADRGDRPVGGASRERASPRRDRHASCRRRRRRLDPRGDRRLRRGLHVRGNGERAGDAPGGRGRARGVGARDDGRRGGEGGDARHRPPPSDHGAPCDRLVVRRREGSHPGAAARRPLARGGDRRRVAPEPPARARRGQPRVRAHGGTGRHPQRHRLRVVSCDPREPSLP